MVVLVSVVGRGCLQSGRKARVQNSSVVLEERTTTMQLRMTPCSILKPRWSSPALIVAVRAQAEVVGQHVVGGVHVEMAVLVY